MRRRRCAGHRHALLDAAGAYRQAAGGKRRARGSSRSQRRVAAKRVAAGDSEDIGGPCARQKEGGDEETAGGDGDDGPSEDQQGDDGDDGHAGGAAAKSDEATLRVLQRRMKVMSLNARRLTEARLVELESVVRSMAAVGKDPDVILIQEAHVTAEQLSRRGLAGYQQFAVLVSNSQASGGLITFVRTGIVAHVAFSEKRALVVELSEATPPLRFANVYRSQGVDSAATTGEGFFDMTKTITGNANREGTGARHSGRFARRQHLLDDAAVAAGVSAMRVGIFEWKA